MENRLHELEKQLELAQVVVRLTNGHMWSIFAADTARNAEVMQRNIMREIERERKGGRNG